MKKAEVLRRIDAGWRELTKLVDDIDPEIFAASTEDSWSPKDHVAHVTAWEEFLLAILEKRDRFQSMGVGDLRGKETDEINDAVFRARRQMAPDAVLGAFAGTHRRVLTSIGTLSESDLQRPLGDFQAEFEDGEAGDETLLDEIEWNTWSHYAGHVEWLAALIAK